MTDRDSTPIRGESDTLFAAQGTSPAEQDHGLVFHAYQGPSGFQELSAQWLQLAESIPGARFNHYPGWYRAFLASSCCDPSSVWFVTAHRQQQLIAIFPLQFQTRTIRMLHPQLLGTLDHDELQLSDFVFAPTPDNADLLYELTLWLRRQRVLRWDLLRLLAVPDDASLAYAARAHLPSGSVALPYEASAYFDTSGTYENATHLMTNKFRSNLRRRTRLAENVAPLRFQSCRRPEELEQAFDTFLDIEASGWKGPCGTSSAIRCQPQICRFYTECVREFGARSECVINLLWHGEQAIAGQFGLHIGRTLHILKVGHRDTNSLVAPGILLQDRTIRDACEDPRVDVLSMVNNPYWAHSFRPQTRDVWLYFMPNWNVRGLLARLGLSLKRYLKAEPQRVAQAPARDG